MTEIVQKNLKGRHLFMNNAVPDRYMLGCVTGFSAQPVQKPRIRLKLDLLYSYTVKWRSL